MATESPAGELGAPAPDFSLIATNGQSCSLGELRGERGLVVVFMCNHCPYVQAALLGLMRDARELVAAGVNVVAINANDAVAYPEDSFDAMIHFAEKWQLPFPYLYDESQAVAQAYGAVCTPECFGFDAELLLRYRGRVDASRKEPLVDVPRDLFDAMQMIARTGEGPHKQWPALGCSVKWKADVD
ncbi:thioredoxin family protein [Paraburkholderia sp.]|uniref:thioredoxin family protein n=1 Tax=Paraburkholderia sp. TaxID=1926495 RepID=UPI00239AF863|nr:thioredoxin family protein [Paraburkholderia sp.]MDE1179158.1 thioredoxin family protein [Paraburkholderia sp.]